MTPITRDELIRRLVEEYSHELDSWAEVYLALEYSDKFGGDVTYSDDGTTFNVPDDDR